MMHAPFANLGKHGCAMSFLNMVETEQKASWVARREGAAFVVHFSGSWSTRSPRPEADHLFAELEPAVESGTLHLDAEHLTTWDSSLLVAVRQVCDWAESRGLAVRLDGLPLGVRRLIELAQAVPENEQLREPESDDLLTTVGQQALASYRGFNGYLDFLGQLCIDLFAFVRGRGRVRLKDFLLVLEDCGAQALPIVSLLSFLTGLIIAFIGVIQLQKFAADIYVADLVGLATTRELGAVMAGVIMAGRTGAAFAAQIGSMQVNEEVDALTTFGISPVQFLVVPRVIALVLMMPLLCACADLIAMLGGMVVAVMISDVTVLQYSNQIQAAVGLNDVLVGIFKSSVFGIIIALAGCYRGLHCGRDASSVGRAATSAVVTSITGIVVADAIFAVMFHLLGI
jgi:phospholipid/cholesterol/gamma-HCH transport system permease protein